MAFIPAPGCCNVTFNFQALGGFVGQTHLDFGKGGAGVFELGDFDLMQVAAQEVFTELGDIAFPGQIDTCIMTLRALDEQFGFVANYTLDTGAAASAATAPQQVTFCLKFGTGLAGRSFRGRTYHVGLTEGGVLSGVVDTTVAENILSFWGTMADAIEGSVSSAEHVVISRYANGAPRTEALVTPVTGISYTTRSTATQRRRAKHHI